MFILVLGKIFERLQYRAERRLPTTLKSKAGVFKFFRFGERFRKVPFSTFRDGLVWTLGPIEEIKLPFKFLRRTMDAA